jgi:membrane protein DedA with SNARE-associated domain
MEKRKALLFTFSIIAIILGWTLFKQFDFENLKFEKTGLAIVYIITFVASIYVLVKNAKKQPKK